MRKGGECGRKEDRECVGVGGKNVRESGREQEGERELAEHSAYHNCVYDKL